MTSTMSCMGAVLHYHKYLGTISTTISVSHRNSLKLKMLGRFAGVRLMLEFNLVVVAMGMCSKDS